MPPECLTVLAPIRPGEVDALRAVLRPIGDDINGTRMPPGGRPHIAFPKSRDHSLRALRDPDRSRSRARAGRGCCMRRSSTAASRRTPPSSPRSRPDFEAIWGKLEGYAGRDSFAAFLKAHAHQPAAYYIAFRDHTVVVDSARRSPLATRPLRRSMPASPRRRVRPRSFCASGRRPRSVSFAPRQSSSTPWPRSRGTGSPTSTRGTLRIVASLGRYPLFRLANRLTGNALPPRRSPFSRVPIDTCAAPAPLADGDEIPSIPSALPAGFREDAVSQNQLTLVTVIGDGGANRVRAVMSAIDSFAKRLAPPGSLIGISTIHFVRWLVIDDGRRLMMVSDYDGSWESYIDEFAEMILSGLDAIWETALGLSSGRRAGSARVQVVPPQPPGAGRGVLQRLSERDGSQHRQRHTRAMRRVHDATDVDARRHRRASADDARRDIQGFITTGYGHLTVAAYMFVRFADPPPARRWIGGIADTVATAAPWPRDAAGANDQAGQRRERRVHRRRACARAAFRPMCCARSRSSSRRASRRRHGRGFSATPRRARRRHGSLADPVPTRFTRS